MNGREITALLTDETEECEFLEENLSIIQPNNLLGVMVSQDTCICTVLSQGQQCPFPTKMCSYRAAQEDMWMLIDMSNNDDDTMVTK